MKLGTSREGRRRHDPYVWKLEINCSKESAPQATTGNEPLVWRPVCARKASESALAFRRRVAHAHDGGETRRPRKEGPRALLVLCVGADVGQSG